MANMNNNDVPNNLEFCFYYKGEEECPFDPDSPDYDNAAGFAWMSESIACHCQINGVEDFLDFILAHMGKWDPYSYEDRFGHYLLANTNISLESRIKFVEKYFSPNYPFLKALKKLGNV